MRRKAVSRADRFWASSLTTRKPFAFNESGPKIFESPAGAGPVARQRTLRGGRSFPSVPGTCRLIEAGYTATAACRTALAQQADQPTKRNRSATRGPSANSRLRRQQRPSNGATGRAKADSPDDRAFARAVGPEPHPRRAARRSAKTTNVSRPQVYGTPATGANRSPAMRNTTIFPPALPRPTAAAVHATRDD